MLAHLSFVARLLCAIPLLPVLFLQARKAKAKVPELEAPKNTKGQSLPEPEKNFTRIISLGESAFAGVGLQSHDRSISGVTAQVLSGKFSQNIEWEVYAKSGYTADAVRKELLPLITPCQADIIIIGLGANDIFELHFPTKWRRDLSRLIQAIRELQMNCPVLIAHLPPAQQFPVLPPLLQWFTENFIRHYHLINQQLAAELEQVFYVNQTIDFNEWADRLPAGCSLEDLFCDGVHPSEFAHQLWGNEIADFIEKESLLPFIR